MFVKHDVTIMSISCHDRVTVLSEHDVFATIDITFFTLSQNKLELRLS